jgi:altronate dehydratase
MVPASSEPERETEIGPPVLHISSRDNVVVATSVLEPGQRISIPAGGILPILDRVPTGHKIAAVAIATGDSVIKFGVDIGTATQDIAPGAHVHVHNLQSERMRGDRG